MLTKLYKVKFENSYAYVKLGIDTLLDKVYVRHGSKFFEIVGLTMFEQLQLENAARKQFHNRQGGFYNV